ncbi:YfiT family bacillithiol transferase [Deinococcus ruber]|uniref:Putative metal-dependent hydrolase GCM10008957_29580 n=1 Tax=Deinococcus ruber TaxID=1848197 RepID=A0A918CC23_9DEIO|nr:putative metal-dependent hydrolase [Deinococcus ruber]GGR14814.1 putative metal-dependent hydrolase [Deinococcus ruber]
MTQDPRFPVGPQPNIQTLTPQERQDALAALRALPAEFRAAFAGLDDAQLNTPYRGGGWTLRQVAHHVPDSHMNAYIRTRLALSEDAPTIRPYDQDSWAALPDYGGDIEVSLRLLDALHERWTRLLSALDDAQWQRTFVHPEYGRVYTLDSMAATYVWHGRHHTAQVLGLRADQGW